MKKEDLPKKISVFPLSNFIIFPNTTVPLNIFEPRYIDMINDSMKSDKMIGLIQPKNSINNPKVPELYEVGCIGKIHSFNETSDGRYLISLSGENCFKVLEEVETKNSFRMVKFNQLENFKEKNSFTKSEKISLLEYYEKYIKIKNLNLDLKEIKEIDCDQLIKFIAMISPFKNIEKQALLESESLKKFYLKLISIIELEIASGEIGNTIN